MGGVMPMDSGETLKPDSAYNNNCDLPSANYVYQKCQELGVPTATLSRWAAYGCPIRPQLLDELAKTKHMVAANIRKKSKESLDQLWGKVILPPEHPGREKLPARCDVKWFYKTFCGTDGEPPEPPETLPRQRRRSSTEESPTQSLRRRSSTEDDNIEEPLDVDVHAPRCPSQDSIWSRVQQLNMYDPLAVLLCVSSYRELHFSCVTKTVNDVSHVVVGTSDVDTGINDTLLLYKEYSHLFVYALQASLHEPEMPLGSEKDPDMLIEETIRSSNRYSKRRHSWCSSGRAA